MNAELKEKLEKYLQANGYYDTRSIRRDEGYDELSAGFFDIFGSDDDQSEEQSELLAAAEAYNDAKMEADRQAEIKANTAEAVFEEIITTAPAMNRHGLYYSRLNQAMAESEQRKLAGMLLAKVREIDTANKSVSDQEYAARITEFRNMSAVKGRCLTALEKFGAFEGEAEGSVNISLAAKFAAGIKPSETHETEEELAKRGL